VATLGLLAGSSLLAGCPPCEPNRIFTADFESCDAPCGWGVEHGSVELVETVHSSQHALRLAAGTIIARDLGIAHDDPYPLDVGLTTDCAATSLTLTVELSAEGSSWVHDLELTRCSDEPAGVRDERPPYQELCGQLERTDDPEAPQGIVIGRLELRVSTTCTVDGILISHRREGC